MHKLEISDAKQEKNVKLIQSSFQTTLLKILKSTIGAGVLSLPYAFSLSGIFGGVLMLIIVGIFNFISWMSMIRAMTRENLVSNNEDLNLPNYIEKYYGEHYLFALCMGSTIILTFGSAVSFIILINSVLQATIPIFSEIYIQFIFWALFFTIINIAALKKATENLNWLTFTGIILCFFVIGFVIGYCTHYELMNDQIQNVSLFKIDRLPVAFGLVLFAYDINGILTEYRAEMKEPYKFPYVLGIGMSIAAFIYISVGIIGYLAFGNNTGQIVTIMIFNTITGNGFRIFFICLMYAYSCSLMVSLLLANIPGLNCLRIVLKVYFKFDEKNQKQNLAINLIYILLETVIPFIFPQFSTILSLLGCVCSVSLGYFIPFILYKDAFWPELQSREKILRSFLLVFGIAGGVMGVILNFIPQQ